MHTMLTGYYNNYYKKNTIHHGFTMISFVWAQHHTGKISKTTSQRFEI